MTAVDEIVPDFAEAFPFDSFNRMQRAVLPALFDSEENVVVSAPTASGKTALAELAICRTLNAGGTALFLAPLRAITNEKEREWERFESLGYSVYVVTGERDLDPRRAELADVLVMTPEKADSASRKHDTRRYGFVTDVDCCVIDEVHLLDSDRRGAVLEVTIARLRRLCAPRIVALSATMPNVEDVASWLDAPLESTFRFGESFRPVPLHAGVETYQHGENAFADKYRRLYRTLDLAQPHIEDDGQALVFVSSRQDTVRAATKARDELADRAETMGARGDYEFHSATDELENETLRQSVLDGVAFHHAGLAKGDRDRIERWFREGRIQLLFSTSTLAWGVNLPARCVVIRDTKLHDPLEGEVDMSPLDLLQMLGRAGRPGYDDAGYAYVLCADEDAERYRRLLRDGTDIESRLATDLEGHLNAEIALESVRDLDEVMDWLDTTYYYVRATRAPERYESAGRLRDRVRTALTRLVDGGFVEVGEDLRVEATALGHLTSRFYLRLETAESFARLASRVASSAGDGDDSPTPTRAADGGSSPGSTRPAVPSPRGLTETTILRTVAEAAEFDRVHARRDEREVVRSVTGPDAREMDPGNRKVLAILTSALQGSIPAELQSDAWVIRQNARRLLAALRALLDRFATPAAANQTRRVAARIETGIDADAVGLSAIGGVGSQRATRLTDQGITTPGDVREAGVEGLTEAGLSDTVANQLYENAGGLPAVAVEWNDFPGSIQAGSRQLCEVGVVNQGDGASAGLRVTVNGREMTAKDVYLGRSILPVAIFGAETDRLEFAVEVFFPDLPLHPFVDRRTVTVE